MDIFSNCIDGPNLSPSVHAVASAVRPVDQRRWRTDVLSAAAFAGAGRPAADMSVDTSAPIALSVEGTGVAIIAAAAKTRRAVAGAGAFTAYGIAKRLRPRGVLC